MTLTSSTRISKNVKPNGIVQNLIWKTLFILRIAKPRIDFDRFHSTRWPLEICPLQAERVGRHLFKWFSLRHLWIHPQ